jgi:integrase
MIASAAAPQVKHAYLETVDKFIAWGKVQGRKDGKGWDETHADNVRDSLRSWFGTFMALDDINEQRFEAKMRDLRDYRWKTKTGERKFSTKTLWHKATNLKTFVHWCVARELLAKDPLRNCRKPSSASTKKCRSLEYAEFQHLRAAACKNKRPETALVYLVAVQTGFRQAELRSLKVRDLDPKKLLLHLAADNEKTNCERWFPITPKLAARLKAAAEGLDAEAPLLKLTHSPINQFNKDLKKAGPKGIPKKTDDGVIDFHGLRRTGSTWLAEAGAPESVRRVWLRHSDRSTSDRYAVPLQKEIRRYMLKVENNLERCIVLGVEECGGYRDRTGDLQTASQTPRLDDVKSLCLHVLAFLEATPEQRDAAFAVLKCNVEEF